MLTLEVATVRILPHLPRDKGYVDFHFMSHTNSEVVGHFILFSYTDTKILIHYENIFTWLHSSASCNWRLDYPCS